MIRILERLAKEEKQHKPNPMKRLGTTERKQYDKNRDKTKYDRNGNPIRPKKKHKPLLGPGRQSKDPLVCLTSYIKIKQYNLILSHDVPSWSDTYIIAMT